MDCNALETGLLIPQLSVDSFSCIFSKTNALEYRYKDKGASQGLGFWVSRPRPIPESSHLAEHIGAINTACDVCISTWWVNHLTLQSIRLDETL
jgi:hypothetical protein